MSDLLRLCQICLHADRSLSVVDSKLLDFHDELCEYTILEEDPLYCGECIYRLKKMYNFKMQCDMAYKIYRKWKKTKSSDQLSPYLLYTVLPSTSLSIWLPRNSKVYEFVDEEIDIKTFKELSTHVNVRRESATNTREFNVKTAREFNVNTVRDSNLNTMRDSSVNTARGSSVNTVRGSNKNTVKGSNVNTVKDSNVNTKKDSNVNTEKGSNVNAVNSFEMFTHVIKDCKSDISLLQDPLYEREVDVEGNQNLNKKADQNTKIKYEIELETALKTIELEDLKMENITDYDEILLDNNDSALQDKSKEVEHDKNSTENISKKQLFTLADFQCSDLDEASFDECVKSPETKTNKNKANTSEKINEAKKKTQSNKLSRVKSKKQFHTSSSSDLDDESSLNSDSDIEHLISPKTKINKNSNSKAKTVKITYDGKKNLKHSKDSKVNKSTKQLLDELDCSELDDFDTSDFDSDEGIINPEVRTDKNTDRIKIVDKMCLKKLLEDISSDTEEDTPKSEKKRKLTQESLTEENIDKKGDSVAKVIFKDGDDVTKKRKITKTLAENNTVVKDVAKEIDRDGIEEDDSEEHNHDNKTKKIEAVVETKVRVNVRDLDKMEKHGKDFVCSLKRKMGPINNKERCILGVKTLFADCGELITEEGVAIDKEFIIQCLQDNVTDYVMNQLRKAVRGAKTNRSRILELLGRIQNKYKNSYDTTFDIQYLNTQEKALKEFADRKNYECYITANAKCGLCFRWFKHDNQLKAHLKCHDVTAGEHVCAVCGVRFKLKRELTVHHLKCHCAVFKCKLCPLVTYKKDIMANHYLLHKGVLFKCEPCNVTFKSRSAYGTHRTNLHSTHICTECGEAFSTELSLKWHTSKHKHHREVPLTAASSPCAHCSLVFASDTALARHVAISHKQIIRQTGKPRIYKTSENKLTCRVCNAVGNSAAWFGPHYAMKHPTVEIDGVQYAGKKTHLCDVCGRGFASVYTLRDHINTHTDVRPYACDQCPKRFYSYVSHKQHSMMHLPPSKSCKLCNKKFKTSSNLLNHMRIHIGNRCYKCELCGKGFLFRNALNTHVRRVHHNEKRVRKRAVKRSDSTEGSS